MEGAPDTPPPNFDDEMLLELASELHRLASGLKRDLQRNSVLPGLSDLAAMQPLQAMLTEALSLRVGRGPDPRQPAEESPSEDFVFPGYL